MKNSYEARFWAIQSFIGGLCVALILAVVILAAGAELNLSERWDTIIVGILSCLVTLGTVGAVYAQIVQARELEEARETRANLAARAAISAPLSNLLEYEKKCIAILLGITINRHDRRIEHQTIEFPGYPANDVPYLVDCIRTADSRSADQLSGVVSKLQIQQARLKSVCESLGHSSRDERNRIVVPHNIESLVVDAIELYAHLEGIFRYARRQDDEIKYKITNKLIKDSLFVSCGMLDESQRPELFELIDHRYPNSNSDS